MTCSTSAVAVCCSSASPQFAQQPRVLDGDDGLIGEAGNKRDLFVGKWADFLAVQGKRADKLVVLEHRNNQKGPQAGEFKARNGYRVAFEIAFRCLNIGDVYGAFGGEHPTDGAIWARPKRGALLGLGEGCRRVERRDHVQSFAVPAVDVAELGVADANGLLQHGREHRLKFAGRTADDLQHLGGRDLLLKRFAQFTQQPRILDGNDGLGSEVFDQIDLLVCEGLHFLPIDA